MNSGVVKTRSGSIPIIRPTLPDIQDVVDTVREAYDSGVVTLGKMVGLFEEQVRQYTDVDHAVAVSSCTSGLMLAFAAMGFPERAEVVVPSFTFPATVQALIWNRLTPVFVDCLPGTMTIDPDEVAKAIGPNTAAILPVTTFGLPPDMDTLGKIAERTGILLICDSAQGLGATYRGKRVGGFGLCEAFSLSPTKVITAIEGGIVTTNDTELAEKLRAMRDYGKDPDGEEMKFNGLSARMSELHASVGLLSLRDADSLIDARLQLIRKYRERTQNLPGCRVQEFPEDRISSGNYFTLLIGKNARADRDGVMNELNARNIGSKRYFYPPVHVQRAFRDHPHRIIGKLPNTWAGATTSLALPLYAHMTVQDHDRVCEAIQSILA